MEKKNERGNSEGDPGRTTGEESGRVGAGVAASDAIAGGRSSGASGITEAAPGTRSDVESFGGPARASATYNREAEGARPPSETRGGGAKDAKPEGGVEVRVRKPRKIPIPSAVPIAVDADDLACILSAGFGMYAQSRHPLLRPAWTFDPLECRAAAAHLARCLSRLPARYIALVSNFADPLAFIIGMYALISEGARREKEIQQLYATHHTTDGGGESAERTSSTDDNGMGGGGTDRANTSARDPRLPYQDRG